MSRSSDAIAEVSALALAMAEVVAVMPKMISEASGAMLVVSETISDASDIVLFMPETMLEASDTMLVKPDIVAGSGYPGVGDAIRGVAPRELALVQLS